MRVITSDQIDLIVLKSNTSAEEYFNEPNDVSEYAFLGEYTFEERQMVTYAFLKAFYTSEEFGYNVDRYTYQDVTQNIIDIVNKMGKEIVTHVRIIRILTILKTLAESLRSGKVADFVYGVLDIAYSLFTEGGVSLLNLVEEELAKEKDRIKKNFFAYAALTQILNREKGNIELKFNGF